MKRIFSAIIVSLLFSVVTISCTKSASAPQPAPGKAQPDTVAVKIWHDPKINAIY